MQRRRPGRPPSSTATALMADRNSAEQRCRGRGRTLALRAPSKRSAPLRIHDQVVINDHDLPHREIQTREEAIAKHLRLPNRGIP